VSSFFSDSAGHREDAPIPVDDPLTSTGATTIMLLQTAQVSLSSDLHRSWIDAGPSDVGEGQRVVVNELGKAPP
jgi:hypothetical protein